MSRVSARPLPAPSHAPGAREKVGVVAVDGTKVAASASNDQTLDFEQIAHEAIAEAKAMMRPGRAGGTVPKLH